MSDAAEQAELMAPHAATAEAFRERSGAARVVVVLDRGEDRTPAVLELAAGPPAVEIDGEVLELPTLTLLAEPAPGTPELKPLAPMRVAVSADGFDIPLVALAYLAGHVRTLAELYPGRSLVSAEFVTSDPELPLTIAARGGEPIVIALGDETFPLEPGWPE